MLILINLMFLTFAVSEHRITNETIVRTMNDTESCYSEENFETVYKFVEDQIKKSEENFYSFKSCQLFLMDGEVIAIKQKNWTESIIHREKGIYSLAKELKANQRHVKKAHEIFCELVALQEKMN